MVTNPSISPIEPIEFEAPESGYLFALNGTNLSNVEIVSLEFLQSRLNVPINYSS